MAPFGQQFFASASPVLTLAPQAAHHQVTAGIRSFSHQVASNFGHSTSHLQLGTWPPAQSLTRGRKRSRDEAAVNLDSSAQSDASSRPTENPFGNSLSIPQSSSNIAPTTFGTTSTTQLPLGQEASDKQDDRPVLRSHKSQRLDQAAITQQQTATISSAGSTVLQTTPEAPSQPVVDDFTLHLGIGWRRISEDVDIQAAARGWARFIENNYPISSAKICLESKGLQSYLVEAAEGFFLFSENLREGRLVSPTVEGALRNLKGQTPVFEGAKMVAGQPSVSQGPSAVTGHADVDMDI